MDLAIEWRNGEGDLVFADGDLMADDSLTTAIIISLFTDQRVDNQRGWWGNQFASHSSEMGSKLWTLSRSKQLADVLIDAQQYAREALQWLLDDQHASHIEVSATNPSDSVLLLTVVVTLPDGAVEQRTFSTVWSV